MRASSCSSRLQGRAPGIRVVTGGLSPTVLRVQRLGEEGRGGDTRRQKGEGNGERAVDAIGDRLLGRRGHELCRCCSGDSG